MRKIPLWLILIILLLGGYLILNLTGPAAEQPSDPLQSTKKPSALDKSHLQTAPDFSLTDLEGNTVSLSDYQGQNIYINFWASWCGPCQLEMPDLEEIYRKYNEDLVVLAVNIGESENKVNSFINANGYTFPVLLDPNGTAAKTYKVSSIPVSIFVNEEGLIVGKQVGLMTYSQMESSVEQLLQ